MSATVVVLAAAVSASVAAVGALLYGTDDDRAFPYIVGPVIALPLLGWAVLIAVLVWSRSRAKARGGGALWLLAGAVALPVVVQAVVFLAFNLAGNFHHYPACPPQHLGPC